MTLIKGADARRYDLVKGSDTPSGRYIHTQAGRFYGDKPTWDTLATAHALGQQARYTGNASIRYSVAEHAVLVSAIVEELGGDLWEILEGLHHDDVESKLSDIASPWKVDLPDYKVMEKRWDASMRLHYALPAEQSEIVTRADWLALFIEAAQIMPEGGQDFTDPNRIRPDALRMRNRGWKVAGIEDWREARDLYMERHAYIMGKISAAPNQV